MAIQNHQNHTGQTSDGLARTEWFNPSVEPTIAGPYECTTGSGHIFTRTWSGQHWISPITGAPTTVRLMWRGVVPGSVECTRYPLGTQMYLDPNIAALALAA